jgi:queuine tRNA-ribosyltransferase
MGYSRAYLHHVFRAREIIGSMRLTRHNLHYFHEIMEDMRSAIAAGRFADRETGFHATRALGDIEPV